MPLSTCAVRKVGSGGYVYVRRHGHPSADRAGWVLEHRLVMAEQIGRPLLRHENVHHKNGNRQDNSPDNLELWVTMQPTGQRVDELLAYAHRVIELYGGLGNG